MNQDERQPISALPGELLRDVSVILHSYSTALLMVTDGSDGQEIARLIGSGTFISSGNVGAILTAAHVVDVLKGPFALGLTLREVEHKYAIDDKYLKIIRIAKGEQDSVGPDLALIILPSSELGTIRATRNFYNLERNRDRMLSAPPDFDMGIWALCGAPDVHTTDEPSVKGFNSLKGIHGLCGFGGISEMLPEGEFDYGDFVIKYDSGPGIPASFGGVSGGGLWQVPLVKRPNQPVEAKEYILSGVAFYQTARTDLHRTIRCHGRRSIYERVWQELKKNS